MSSACGDPENRGTVMFQSNVGELRPCTREVDHRNEVATVVFTVGRGLWDTLGGLADGRGTDDGAAGEARIRIPVGSDEADGVDADPENVEHPLRAISVNSVATTGTVAQVSPLARSNRSTPTHRPLRH